MYLIEMCGMAGSGKSSITSALVKSIAATDDGDLSELDIVVHEPLHGSKKIKFHLVRVLYSFWMLFRYPAHANGTCMEVWRLNKRKPLRFIVCAVSMLYKLGLIMFRSKSQKFLFLDEGVIHSTWSALIFSSHDSDRLVQTVERLFQQNGIELMLIHVNVEESTNKERFLARSLVRRHRLAREAESCEFDLYEVAGTKYPDVYLAYKSIANRHEELDNSCPIGTEGWRTMIEDLRLSITSWVAEH